MFATKFCKAKNSETCWNWEGTSPQDWTAVFGLCVYLWECVCVGGGSTVKSFSHWRVPLPERLGPHKTGSVTPWSPYYGSSDDTGALCKQRCVCSMVLPFPSCLNTANIQPRVTVKVRQEKRSPRNKVWSQRSFAPHLCLMIISWGLFPQPMKFKRKTMFVVSCTVCCMICVLYLQDITIIIWQCFHIKVNWLSL